jgi:hypothetical protein
MNNYKLDGVITALSQITQTGDQKTGASTMLPVKDVWDKTDTVQVPYISGNSVRGRLRRLIMSDLCDLVGYTFANEHVWHAFFGGGQLQAVGPSGVVDVGMRKEITRLIPPVALWGFSLGNQVLESKLVVFDMDVLCDEMRPYVPDKYKNLCTSSFNQCVSNVMFTRRDDKQSGRVKDDDDPAIQMKVEVQVLVTGTRFYHGFIVRRDPSPIEVSCLHRAIVLWRDIPNIGGKSGSGFGRLDLAYEGTIDDRPYLDFITASKEAIVAYLQRLETNFAKHLEKKPSKKKAKTKGDETDEQPDGQVSLESFQE